ncbi:MAG TPA: HEAT repeat domain-containing protein [Gaiellaceae bacterium]
MDDVFIPVEAEIELTELLDLLLQDPALIPHFIRPLESYLQTLTTDAVPVPTERDAGTEPSTELQQALEQLHAVSADADPAGSPSGGTGDAANVVDRLRKAIAAPRIRTSDATALATRTGQDRVRLTVEQLVQLPHLVVQGDPGSGKSTLTQYLAWTCGSGESRLVGGEIVRRVPIRIRAIEFGEALEHGRVTDLVDFLLIESGRFSSLVQHALLTGETLVLLDGLDEVGETGLRGRVAEKVSDYIADPLFSANLLFVTTRIVGYERGGLLGQFPHVTLVHLSDEQIAAFVTSWYSAIKEALPEGIDVDIERRQLLDAVQGNASIQRLARSPLLLTIIALIKWQGRALPDQRVLLYDAAAQTLIKSWPLSQREVELDELFIREWIAPVALKVFSNPLSDLIDEYTLMDELVLSMRSLKSLPELDARRDSKALLDDVARHSGILLPRGTDSDGRNLYGFLHQTFAEYLSAYYLAGHWEEEQVKIADYAHDPYWLEVILLMAGHLGTQRRSKAGKLVAELKNLSSSKFEPKIRRDLLLAATVLADGVPVAPPELVEEVLSDVLSNWLETPLQSVRQALGDILTQLRKTEYAAVVARIGRERGLSGSTLVSLAALIGAQHFLEPLHQLLEIPRDDPHDPTAAYAASLLVQDLDDEAAAAFLLRDGHAEIGPDFLLHPLRMSRAPGVTDGLVDLLWRGEEDARAAAARTLGERRDAAAIDALVEFSVASKGYLAYVGAAALQTQAQSNPIGVCEALLRKDLTTAPPDVLALVADLGGEAGASHLAAIFRTTDDDYLFSRLAPILAASEEPTAHEALIEELAGDDAGRSYEVARSLLPQRDEAAIDALLRLSSSGPSEMRLAAAATLATVGDRRGIDLVTPVPDQPALAIRVAEILADLGDSDALGIAQALSENASQSIRLSAARVMIQFGDHRAADVLAELIDDPPGGLESDVHPYWKAEVASELARIGDARAADALERLVFSAHSYRIPEIINVLARLDLERAADVAFRYLANADAVYIVESVVEFLSAQDPALIANRVQKLLEAPRARDRALAVHLAQKGSDIVGTPTLVNLLQDESAAVRSVTAAVLMTRPNHEAAQAVAARIESMLDDHDVPDRADMPWTYVPTSVAEAAYQYLVGQLTPRGELTSQSGA